MSQGQMVRAEVAGIGTLEFPAGTDPVVIQQTVKRVIAERQQPATAPQATATADSSWVDTAVNAIPAVAGAAGGIVGGIGGTAFGMGVGGVPGAVGGAAVGGSAGEALRQLIERHRGRTAPTSAGEAAQDIGVSGAVQGASELAGHGLMRGASAVGRGLMDNAIRPSMTMAREFPDLVETAIKERLPVGGLLPGARTGQQQAKSLLRESAGKTRKLLAEASAKGVDFDAASVVRAPITELAGKIAKQPISGPDLTRLSSMMMQFLKEKGSGRLSPQLLKDIKQSAQSLAKPIFKAEAAGNAVGADQAIGARFNDAVASGAKEALETISGVGASEARTQSLIGVTKAIRAAEQKRAPLWAELAAQGVGAGVGAGVATATGGDYAKGVGGGLATTALARMLLSPRTMSRAALTLTKGEIQELIRQTPRGAVAAMLELVAAKEATSGKTQP